MRWRDGGRALVALTLLGCAPSLGAALLPRAAVHAAVSERGAVEARRAAWSVRAELRWTLDRPPPPPAPAPTAPIEVGASCAGSPLCAWERRAARRALRRVSGAGR